MPEGFKSGNIGEHSELLAFAQIIVAGSLELGVPGERYSQVNRAFLPVLGVSRTPAIGTKVSSRKNVTPVEVVSRNFYRSVEDDVTLNNEPGGSSRRVCSKSELIGAIQGLKTQLIYWSSSKFKAERSKNKKLEKDKGVISSTKALQSEYSQRILDLLGLETLRAKSGSKSDIYLTIDSSGSVVTQGFSVKSQMGSRSCLVNHSGSTVFRYEIFNAKTEDALKVEELGQYYGPLFLNEVSVKKHSRHGPAAIVPALFSMDGVDIKFDTVLSGTFRDSLEMIDGRFPAALAMVILQRFKTGRSRLADLVYDDELHAYLVSAGVSANNAKRYLEEKVKDLLRKFALGMQAGTPWNDSAEVKGGWVLVIKDGQVVGYRFDSTDEFRDYLLANTMIDTPSTSRVPQGGERIGHVYESDGRLFILLSLIVKFTD
jgi:hypothetical protein